MRSFGLIAIAAVAGFAGVYGLAQPEARSFAAASLGPVVSSDCNIKGNVSINSGERIYHVPGQNYYEDTIIRLEYGERWFCNEAEARSAGWRRAGY